MSSEPTYPADAVPGRVTPPAPPEPAATAPVTAIPAPPTEPRTNWQKVGVRAAIGIGSAAVAAALLYANRSRKD